MKHQTNLSPEENLSKTNKKWEKYKLDEKSQDENLRTNEQKEMYKNDQLIIGNELDKNLDVNIITE